MSTRRPPRDHESDDPLWRAVTKDVKPLARRRRQPLPKAEPVQIQPKQPPKALPKKTIPALPAQAAPRPAPPTRRAKGLPAVEMRLLKSIRRGRTPIDLRLDLHGQRQAEAHRAVERMLAGARLRGQRVVLIVTGTGLRRRLASERDPSEEGPGVLRLRLALWLSEPPFQDWVLGFSQAGPEHGGAGAFYVVLRRA